jgi:hypothetical protein
MAAVRILIACAKSNRSAMAVNTRSLELRLRNISICSRPLYAHRSFVVGGMHTDFCQGWLLDISRSSEFSRQGCWRVGLPAAARPAHQLRYSERARRTVAGNRSTSEMSARASITELLRTNAGSCQCRLQPIYDPRPDLPRPVTAPPRGNPPPSPPNLLDSCSSAS